VNDREPFGRRRLYINISYTWTRFIKGFLRIYTAANQSKHVAWQCKLYADMTSKQAFGSSRNDNTAHNCDWGSLMHLEASFAHFLFLFSAKNSQILTYRHFSYSLEKFWLTRTNSWYMQTRVSYSDELISRFFVGSIWWDAVNFWWGKGWVNLRVWLWRFKVAQWAGSRRIPHYSDGCLGSREKYKLCAVLVGCVIESAEAVSKACLQGNK
jgi:hypothetical protein